MRLWKCMLLVVCCACLFGCSGEQAGTAAAQAQVAALERSSEQAGAAAGEGASAGAHTEIEVPALSDAPPVQEPPEALQKEMPEQDVLLPSVATAAAPVDAGEGAFVNGAAPEAAMVTAPANPALRAVADGMGLDAAVDVFEIVVTYQTEELVSGLVELQEGDGVTLLPFTSTVEDGAPCELGTFFSDTDTGWKSLMPDLVAMQAQERGMTLLCEVPPVTEDHPYYIDDGCIVLLYRPYEITTYESGTPQFRMDMQALSEYTTGAHGVGMQE